MNDEEAKLVDAESALDEIVSYLGRVSHRNSVAYDATYRAYKDEPDSVRRKDKLAHHEQVSCRLHEVNSILGCVQTMVAAHRRLKDSK